MKTQILQALKNIGIEQLPDDSTTPLALYGLDSLKMAMLAMELERLLDFPIDLGDFSEEAFTSIDSIEQWIEQFETV